MTIPIRVYLLFLVGIFIPVTVSAQESCAVLPEAIEVLGEADVRTYNVWDVVYGVPEEDEFFYDYLPIDEEKVILAGSIKNDLKARPFILSTDRRGRVFWPWKGNPDSETSLILKRILDIDGKRFLTAGRLIHESGSAPQGIWLGIFNSEDGTLVKTHVIQEKGVGLELMDLEEDIDGTGYILTAVQERTKELPSHARFYLLDAHLELVKDRSFIPAHENKIHDILVTENRHGEKFYLAAGEAKDAHGRTEAVILRLDEYLNVMWRRSFPRGAGSRFFGITRSKLSEITAVGDVLPAQEDASQAGLLISIDLELGRETKERYYTHPAVDYRGKDILSFEDGRSVLILAGDTRDEKRVVDHARLLVLSPRGVIMEDRSYSHGRGAHPEEMKIGPAEHIYIGGSATIEDPDPEDPENNTVFSRDGWMVVAPALDTYEDPCIPKLRGFTDG